MSLPRKCPVGKPRKRSSRKDLEGSVVRDCLKFLIDCPDVVYVERRNTGAVKFQGGGFIRFGQKGAGDIWCLVKLPLYEMDVPADPDEPLRTHLSSSYLLKHVEIECKRADGKGRQSADQKTFQEFCEEHRIPYILTISANDLSEQIRAIIS